MRSLFLHSKRMCSTLCSSCYNKGMARSFISTANIIVFVVTFKSELNTPTFFPSYLLKLPCSCKNLLKFHKEKLTYLLA
jgi:hypothetical protein